MWAMSRGHINPAGRDTPLQACDRGQFAAGHIAQISVRSRRLLSGSRTTEIVIAGVRCNFTASSATQFRSHFFVG
jgi:hypothetical protein